MSTTQPSDYKESVRISQNELDQDILHEYLDEKEPEYLTDLLGCDLYALYEADLDVNGVPQTAPYTTIYEPLCIDDDCGQNRSRGIKEMLKGFMYFEYVREQHEINSSIGMSKSKGIASDLLLPASTTIKRPYNRSINDYQNIQYYICQNETDFPTYKGITKESISIL